MPAVSAFLGSRVVAGAGAESFGKKLAILPSSSRVDGRRRERAAALGRGRIRCEAVEQRGALNAEVAGPPSPSSSRISSVSALEQFKASGSSHA